MSYVIEKSVPIPPEPRGRKSKYPFCDMQVTDSIFIGDGEYQNVRNAASKHGRDNGKVFTCRRVDGGYRIWRIA